MRLSGWFPAMNTHRDPLVLISTTTLSLGPVDTVRDCHGLLVGKELQSPPITVALCGPNAGTSTNCLTVVPAVCHRHAVHLWEGCVMHGKGERRKLAAPIGRFKDEPGGTSCRYSDTEVLTLGHDLWSQ